MQALKSHWKGIALRHEHRILMESAIGIYRPEQFLSIAATFSTNKEFNSVRNWGVRAMTVETEAAAVWSGKEIFRVAGMMDTLSNQSMTASSSILTIPTMRLLMDGIESLP